MVATSNGIEALKRDSPECFERAASARRNRPNHRRGQGIPCRRSHDKMHAVVINLCICHPERDWTKLECSGAKLTRFSARPRAAVGPIRLDAIVRNSIVNVTHGLRNREKEPGIPAGIPAVAHRASYGTRALEEFAPVKLTHASWSG